MVGHRTYDAPPWYTCGEPNRNRGNGTHTRCNLGFLPLRRTASSIPPLLPHYRYYKNISALGPLGNDYGIYPDPARHRGGRTYRYFDGPVLYPFGFGLSYASFAYVAVTRAVVQQWPP